MTILNIILLGDTGVGKTSIINRFKDNIFSAEHDGTLGVKACGSKNVVYQGQAVKPVLYDAEGSNQYHEKIKGEYVAKSHGIVLVVSPTESELTAGFPENFITRAKANIELWKTWCDKIPKFDKDTPIVIAINKSDLIDEAHLPAIEKALATVIKEQGIYPKIFFTSAKTGVGIVADNKQLIKNTLLFDRVTELAYNKAHHIKIEMEVDYIKPPLISQMLGALLAMLSGPIAATLVYNPLACLYYQISLDQWREHRLLNIFLIIISPFAYPFAGIVGEGFIKQMEAGWRYGLVRGINTPLEIFKGRKIGPDIELKENNKGMPQQTNESAKKKDVVVLQKETKMPVRAILVSLIITGLIAAAVWCILFPPAGVAAILPIWIAAAGLSSFSTFALASIVAAGIATILSLPFLIGDNIYRFYHPHYITKDKSSELELSQDNFMDGQTLQMQRLSEKGSATTPIPVDDAKLDHYSSPVGPPKNSQQLPVIAATNNALGLGHS